MIFGKIDYLNLLPFLVFMKQNLRSSSERASFFNKLGVPSKINRLLSLRVVHAGFISSIRSQKFKCTNAGIISQNDVQSVFVLPQDEFVKDRASETSNALAMVLKQKGRVIIGDEGIKEFYRSRGAIDLGRMWREKTDLPFVFARLCCNKHYKRTKKIAKKFTQKKIKIPQYILKQYAQKTSIEEYKILRYLTKIDYKIGTKEKLALKKFLFLAKRTSKNS